MACPGDHDQVFGPTVDPSCRFDFTLAFEDVFFACLPAALLLCLAPGTLFVLLRRPCTLPLKSKFLACQVVSISLLQISSTYFLILPVKLVSLLSPWFEAFASLFGSCRKRSASKSRGDSLRRLPWTGKSRVLT